MSVKRFTPSVVINYDQNDVDMYEDPDYGEWVKYEDYLELEKSYRATIDLLGKVVDGS